MATKHLRCVTQGEQVFVCCWLHPRCNVNTASHDNRSRKRRAFGARSILAALSWRSTGCWSSPSWKQVASPCKRMSGTLSRTPMMASKWRSGPGIAHLVSSCRSQFPPSSNPQVTLSLGTFTFASWRSTYFYCHRPGWITLVQGMHKRC
ncbi:hypothetical protein J4Q44_G00177280 [Coregonus suidteri]|uniref:Uncharacterized protein n=1 Tax=Coregonus suidteri TaxID=861788 RepID=A0AAN8QQ26_9TELE